jgi:small conductance mechanosensitive channel
MLLQNWVVQHPIWNQRPNSATWRATVRDIRTANFTLYPAMSDSKNPPSMMRARILEFILILLAALVVALLARNLADRGLVPESYILPIYVTIVLVGGYLVIRIVNGIIERVVEPTLGATRAEGVKNLFQVVAGIVLIVFVFAMFGVNLTAALIGAGFLGIVLGLAAQQVLGNIFAGLSMLVSKPFEIGDRVTIATSSYGLTGSTYAHESQASGFIGVIQDVGIFFTRVLLDNGTPAVFPNSVVIGALIINYSKITLRTVRVRMDIDKKMDYDKFKARILESLKKHDTIDARESSIEVVDVGATTYEVVIAVRARSEFEEPVRTLVIREGMKVQEVLSGA